MIFREDLPEVSEATFSDFMRVYYAFQQMTSEDILRKPFQHTQQERQNSNLDQQ